MAVLRLALNQVDLTVGDIAGTAELVVRWTRHAAEQGAQLVAFPETVLTGHAADPLGSRSALVDLARRLAEEGLGETPVVLGRPAGSSQNCAELLHRGHVVTHPATPPVVRLHGIEVALAVGQDLGQEDGRVQAARQAGAGLLLVVNASPYAAGRADARLDLLRRRAREAGCTLAHVNLTGGQDERVFDGDSAVVDAKGDVLARAPQFEEGCLLVDLDLPLTTADAGGPECRRHVISGEPAPEPAERVAPGQARRMDELEEIYAALVCGVRAYVAKSGPSSVLVGLSGGLDSALVATIAADAIGSEHVHGVWMPSEHPPQHAREDAAELARRTGLNFRTVPVTPMVDAFTSALELTGLAAENLRSRLRGTLLAAVADQDGRIVLACGNRSDLAADRSPPNAAWAGVFAPIRDVSRTLVLRLAKWRNAAAAARGEVPPIPETTLAKGPSPDEVLDAVLTAYVEEDRSPAEIVELGYAPELVAGVIARFDAAQRISPPGPRITPKR